ncbi:hypothetical protein WR25_03989 isoform A [Diploscapter pachys]|uniref:Uncharacterized protein n=2 Tax=Diploscapter pachys TaxID=2018661 RepID=A0A2A2KQ43_9BILA|nr:hypothetical protein WR25_03989 isoform A [Diploscapter pachys]
MAVSTVNDVQIFNLSYGRAIPDWLSSNARRKLERKNIDVRRRIQLIQDFEMPDVSHTVNVSPDGRYVFTSGIYKPYMKCFDLNDLALKFERGIDAEIIKLLVLSDDYSKVVMLEDDRYLEFHAAFGRYFRMRIPRFGRDMAFCKEASDLFIVGNSSEIYRLNLEQGEWLPPLQSAAPAINCAQFSSEHQLFLCGTSLGQVEAWDHRDGTRVGVLPAVESLCSAEGSHLDYSQVTALAFRDPLHIGVGTSSGHVLLYDIRSRKPLLIKDHNNDLPIKKIDFARRDESTIALSMDERMLKMWDESSGRPIVAIENTMKFNDFVRYKDSGMLFFAVEAPRMLQYFVPLLGPAPKWCSYLESVTEELEAAQEESAVYDDYMFVTKEQLDELGLSALIGTPTLRAYMHGFLIDARLYNKANTLTRPFAYDNYKKNKVKELLHKEREQETIKKPTNLPKVNTALAAKLQEGMQLSKDMASLKGRDKQKVKKVAEAAQTILHDERFKKIFENHDFEVDEKSEAFEKVSQITANLAARKKPRVALQNDEMDSASGSDNDETFDLRDQENGEEDEQNGTKTAAFHSSSDEDEDLSMKARRNKERLMRRKASKAEQRKKYKEQKEALRVERQERLKNKPKAFKLVEVAPGESTSKFMDEHAIELNEKTKDMPFALQKKKIDREKSKLKMRKGEQDEEEATPFGGREMTFKISRETRADREKLANKEHKAERRAVARLPTRTVTKGLKKLPGNLKNVGKKTW